MSNADDQEKKELFIVLVNEEEQYSFWPKGLDIPKGWRHTGTEGTKEECGAYVKQVWTDMRPLSLRKKMAEFEAQQAAARQAQQGQAPPSEPAPSQS